MSVPLYLFTGPEIGERSDAVEELRKRFEKKFGTLDVHKLYTSESSISDVVSLLMNGTLFAAFRFIVLSNAETIKKKEDIELVSEWISSNDGNSALILISNEISVDKKLESLVPKENKKIFWELFQDRKEQWLRSFFQRENFKITDDAITSILELCENDTLSLNRECSRFFVCFEKDHIISAEDVENILSHNREENVFTLFDAMTMQSSATERFEKSLEILQKIRLSNESNGVQLIAGLTYSFRKLLIWYSLVDNNVPSQFDLKIKGFASKKAQEQCRRACALWNKHDVMRILALLAEIDISMRSGGAALEEIFLQLLVYSITVKKGENIEKFTEPFAC